ncbi:hypothetical protein DFH09DRAFT_1069063 [Mycena vulgaris]|nr:hypothetical protein DFH09DRAFT_1069063 [Mycena vulgaris]
MQRNLAKRHVSEEDYRKFDKQIAEYFQTLVREADPALEEETDKRLREFFDSLHSLGAGWKGRLYRLMNGKVDTAADEQLRRIWEDYKIDSTGIQSPRRAQSKWVQVYPRRPSVPTRHRPKKGEVHLPSPAAWLAEFTPTDRRMMLSDAGTQQKWGWAYLSLPAPTLGRPRPSDYKGPERIRLQAVYIINSSTLCLGSSEGSRRQTVRLLRVLCNALPPGHGQQYQMDPTRFDNPGYNPYGITDNASPSYYAQQQYQNNPNQGYNWGVGPSA